MDRERRDKSLSRALVFAIGLIVPFGMGVRQCERVDVGDQCNPDAGGKACGCEYDGKHYDAGTSFKSSDGCNDCSCGDDGNAVCTLRACVPVGKTCGGFAGIQCDDGQFCSFASDANCGAADRSGTCTDKPEVCTAQYDPVCGCDGKTYGNACSAASNGISIASKGECSTAADGCDYNGKHYAVDDKYKSADGCNDCGCQSDGSTVCTKRACQPSGTSCGSRGQQACADGEYCKWEPAAMCGRADASGTCTKIVQACTKEYKPVCGCDGKTYGNACTAGAASVSVDYDGECKSGGCDYNGQHYDTGASFKSADGCNECSCSDNGMVACTLRACVEQTCGGLTGASCPDGQYCDFPRTAQCGAADQTGTCKAKPQVCNDIAMPVCGCDDKTYGNACSAAAAGVSTISDGACGGSSGGGCDYDGKHYNPGDGFPSSDGCNSCGCQDDGSVVCTLKACVPNPGKTCGGIAGLQCDKGQYCNFAPDAQCGAADQTGTCAAIPDVCDDLYKPVCGCDDKTYGNACQAAAAGVSARDGACAPDGMKQTCGGLTGAQCGADQYCSFAPDAICGAADATGTCETRPQICTDIYMAVCGCDGKTYPNECYAQRSGVSVSATGECK